MNSDLIIPGIMIAVALVGFAFGLHRTLKAKKENKDHPYQNPNAVPQPGDPGYQHYLDWLRRQQNHLD